MWWGDVKTLNIWKEEPKKEDKVNKTLSEGIGALGLSVRAFNCLKRIDCMTVKEVIDLIDNEKISRVRGLGNTTEKEIRTAVEKYKEFHKI